MFHYLDDPVKHVGPANVNQFLCSILLYKKGVVGISKQTEILAPEERMNGAF